MNYTEISNELIYKFKSEDELVRAIMQVSNDFTRERNKLGDYLLEEKFVAAYTAFYFTTNYPKFDQIVKKISYLKDILNDSDIVEIGSGPGSFTFAFAEYTSGEIFGIESSKLMRLQAQKIKDKYFADSNIKFISGASSVPSKNKKRVLVFTNSFNEMSESVAMDYIRKLQGDYILFIEPGTKEVFNHLLEIREKLVHKKYNILYPCSQNSACPLQDKDDWCHQYLKLDLDHDLKRLSQLVKINRKWQAACIHLYSLNDSNNEKQKIILRTFSKTKFSKDWQLCESNSIKELKNFKRDYSKEDYKELDEFLAGDIVNYEVIKILKTNELRVKTDL